ncbi:MAG: 50S ribosomal protein L11 methyltransferase [Clostridia bacterium]|nr:50S ribosomal protein L11 methyltransferase [Clostridia bacterium]
MSNEWTEVCITVDGKDTDRAADIANMLVPYGLYIEDYSDLEQGAREIAHIDLIDEELLAKDRTRSLIHLYLSPEDIPSESLAFLRERLTANGIQSEVVTNAVSEEDWANNWKQYFKPLTIGDKLLICPTWETVEDTEGRTVLPIDPGMAFGTGGHETTRLVLEAMETVITDDTALLDVGCGSGILSIAALLLGAKSALAVDIDALAVKTAIENGERSGLTPPRYTVVEGDLLDKVSGTFDLVVANIVADAIILLSPAVKPFVKADGVYIVSGIIDTREAEVVEALKACGFAIESRFEQRGWLCFVCRHA